MDEEHDSFSCAECVLQVLHANHHVMKVIVSCMSDFVYWSCDACEVSEKWIINHDINASNEIIRAFLNMHCIDHFALVVE